MKRLLLLLLIPISLNSLELLNVQIAHRDNMTSIRWVTNGKVSCKFQIFNKIAITPFDTLHRVDLYNLVPGRSYVFTIKIPTNGKFMVYENYFKIPIKGGIDI